MQVLEQRVAKENVVVGVADDGRNRGEAGLLRGPPATLAHDELVAVTERANDDRLQEADLAQVNARARRARPRRTPAAAASGSARCRRPATRRTERRGPPAAVLSSLSRITLGWVLAIAVCAGSGCESGRPGRARRSRRPVGISAPSPRPRPPRRVLIVGPLELADASSVGSVDCRRHRARRLRVRRFRGPRRGSTAHPATPGRRS